MTKSALIIDDNTTDQQILAQLLGLKNLICHQIFDPAQLNSFLEKNIHIDIIFIDLEMPHLNGYQVFEILKKHFGNSVQLILYTANTNEVSHARIVGFNGCIPKPINVQLFLNQVESMLAGVEIWDFR